MPEKRRAGSKGGGRILPSGDPGSFIQILCSSGNMFFLTSAGDGVSILRPNKSAAFPFSTSV